MGPFTAISDLEYFRLGFYHYLAVADSEKAHLYTWKKGEMTLKQTVPVPNLAQVFSSSVESCRDEVMLFMVSWSGEICLCVFSGETENFKKAGIGEYETFKLIFKC